MCTSCDIPVMSQWSSVDLSMSGFERALASRVKSSSTWAAMLSVSLLVEVWEGCVTLTAGRDKEGELWSLNFITSWGMVLYCCTYRRFGICIALVHQACTHRPIHAMPWWWQVRNALLRIVYIVHLILQSCPSLAPKLSWLRGREQWLQVFDSHLLQPCQSLHNLL